MFILKIDAVSCKIKKARSPQEALLSFIKTLHKKTRIFYYEANHQSQIID